MVQGLEVTMEKEEKRYYHCGCSGGVRGFQRQRFPAISGKEESGKRPARGFWNT